MKLDALDFAYFVFGVKACLHRAEGTEPHSTFRPYEAGGELDFVGLCLPFADLLAVDPLPPAFAGVWVYDVAEPFGDFVAERLSQDGALSRGSAAVELARLIKEHCI